MRKLGPSLVKILHRQSNAPKSVLNAVGVNLMNDRSKIADDHAKRGDVVSDHGKIDFDLNSHFQSPVGVCPSTVQTPGEGVTPRAFAGASPC